MKNWGRVTLAAVALGIVAGAAALAGNADLLSKGLGSAGIVVAIVCVFIAGAGPSFLSALGVTAQPASYPGTSPVLHVPTPAAVPSDLTPSDTRVRVVDTDAPARPFRSELDPDPAPTTDGGHA